MRSLLLIAVLICLMIMPVMAGHTDKDGNHHDGPYILGCCINGSDLLNFLAIVVAMKIMSRHIKSKKLQLTGCLS